jgi:amidase
LSQSAVKAHGSPSTPAQNEWGEEAMGKLSADDSGIRRTSPASGAELCCKSLAEVAVLLRRGDVSSEVVTRAVLDRIAALDGELHSYVNVAADSAIQQARTADREISSGAYRGPLHGIPVGVKDLVFTADMPTTCGSSILARWTPQYNATIVDRLRDAGAVLLGKHAMTEFAGTVYHPSVVRPTNPWKRDRWPGASSSGSAVATAAGLCFAAIGSDTGGSIRFPAAACGIVGLKPTYGRVSRWGVFPLAESLDHVGPLARTVEDAALVLQAVAGEDRFDPTTLRDPVPDYSAALKQGVKGFRLAVDEDFCTHLVEADVAQALLGAVRQFEQLGADVTRIHLSGLEGATAVWGTIFAVESAAAHEKIYAEHAAEYNPTFRSSLDESFKISATDYARALVKRNAILRALEKFLDHADLLLWPAMSAVTPPFEELAPGGVISAERAEDLLRFTAPLSLTGHPALTFGCGFNREGLPIELQLVGRRGEERSLLRAGYAYQQATGWHRRLPPV